MIEFVVDQVRWWLREERSSPMIGLCMYPICTLHCSTHLSVLSLSLTISLYPSSSVCVCRCCSECSALHTSQMSCDFSCSQHLGSLVSDHHAVGPRHVRAVQRSAVQCSALALAAATRSSASSLSVSHHVSVVVFVLLSGCVFVPLPMLPLYGCTVAHPFSGFPGTRPPT